MVSMRNRHDTRWLGTLALIAGAAASPALAQSIGPDVTLADVAGTMNHGLVGTIRAYSIGSHTCNIGTSNLLWTNSGTPGLAMNVYRLHDGRIMQLGLSFAKTACCAAAGGSLCGSCNGAGGSVLGAGCLDVYSASWNSQQSRLAPRSGINGYTGTFAPIPSGTGNAVWRRTQVNQSDMVAANFPGAIYFIEGVYAATDDATAGNSLNNASYKRVAVDASFNLNVQGSMAVGIPALHAWRDHGNGINMPDVSVSISHVTVPGEGRFHYGVKVKDLGNGLHRYDYAIFNLNSDRSGGSFSVPVPSGVTISDIGFHAPLYHSGEPYSNTPWTSTIENGALTWSTPETYAQNQNSSALRWGTMYNFWFTANTAPQNAQGALGLFKPHATSSVALSIQAPTQGSCYANCDASTQQPTLNVADFTCFLQQYASGNSYANCDGSTKEPVLNVADFTCFLKSFAGGCE